jgi:hypothetical protein
MKAEIGIRVPGRSADNPKEEHVCLLVPRVECSNRHQRSDLGMFRCVDFVTTLISRWEHYEDYTATLCIVEVIETCLIGITRM